MNDQIEIELRYKTQLAFIAVQDNEIALLESILADLVRDLIQNTDSTDD